LCGVTWLNRKNRDGTRVPRFPAAPRTYATD